MALIPTASQTVGPFFRYGLEREEWIDLTAMDPPGERIRILGTLVDGAGDPVPDGVVEIWQADAVGTYPAAASAFHGFGRACTDHEGRFHFLTIKPGAVAASEVGTMQAPHINVTVFARGLTRHTFTRIYFSDCAGANDADPLLMALGEAERATLIAARTHDAAAIPTYHFDIILQGARETVFLEI